MFEVARRAPRSPPLVAVRRGREGWAFAATSVDDRRRRSLSLFVDLYPQRDGLEHQLGVQPHRRQHRASGSYALKVMTVVAVVLSRSCCSTRAGPTACSAQRIRTADFAVTDKDTVTDRP